MRRKGLIHVYTGDGKGKTTAAVGLAVRAIGHNLRVCYISFHKNPRKWGYGEIKILKKVGVDIFNFSKRHPRFYKNLNREKVRNECLKGIEFIKQIYRENKYDVLILDEIIVSLRDGFIKKGELFELIDMKPSNLELIMTGRGATKNIFAKAHLVSEIKNRKHPFAFKIKRRKGIEY